MSETKPDLMAELAEVVRLSERDSVYPGPWHWSANGNIVTDTPLTGCDPEIAAVYSERNDDAAPDNAKLIIAAVNFLRTHHAELKAVARKAARYDWLNAHRLDSLTRNNMHDPRVCLPVGTDIFQQDAMDKAIDQAMHNSAREG